MYYVFWKPNHLIRKFGCHFPKTTPWPEYFKLIFFQDDVSIDPWNFRTDGYEEDGKFLYGRDIYNYFSDKFHIDNGPHSGYKYDELIGQSNRLRKQIMYIWYVDNVDMIWFVDMFFGYYV